MMLYSWLLCKFGGVKTTFLCRLVKSGDDKICATVREVGVTRQKKKVVKMCFYR